MKKYCTVPYQAVWCWVRCEARRFRFDVVLRGYAAFCISYNAALCHCLGLASAAVPGCLSAAVHEPRPRVQRATRKRERVRCGMRFCTQFLFEMRDCGIRLCLGRWQFLGVAVTGCGATPWRVGETANIRRDPSRNIALAHSASPLRGSAKRARGLGFKPLRKSFSPHREPCSLSMRHGHGAPASCCAATLFHEQPSTAAERF